ncbi:MAG: leucine-rich repeat domain-containing protein [Gemmiger sp.]
MTNGEKIRAMLLAGAGTAVLLAVPCAAEELPLESTVFGNAALLEELRGYDYDGSGTLDTDEVDSVRSLWLDDADAGAMTGLEHLTELRSFSCSGADFESLDLTRNEKLTSVYVYDSELQELKLPASVEDVDVEDAQLTSLDLSGCTGLVRLDVSGNRLETLDLAACTWLEQLDAAENRLTALDVTACPRLQFLNCTGNQLTELDLSGCRELVTLWCADNALTSLDLTGLADLADANVNDNRLTELDMTGCGALTSLYCSGNRLTSLNVAECRELDWLSCFDNALEWLDLSHCKELTRGDVLVDDDCSVRYSGFLGVDWHGVLTAARVLLGVVAAAGAIVWLARRLLRRG